MLDLFIAFHSSNLFIHKSTRRRTRKSGKYPPRDERTSRDRAESKFGHLLRPIVDRDGEPSKTYFLLPTMLPRNLQSLVARTANRTNPLTARHSVHAPPFRIEAASQRLAFHSSSRQQNEAPKSPFQTFVDVLKDELRKNRELQDNVKQLQGDVEKFQDSETMKQAKAAYERARVRNFLLGCPV